jgi:enoyl-CoA hydratase/carnithine racemase
MSYVLFEEIPGKSGNVGVITLNRPDALNALNHEMILALDEKLAEWEISKLIKAVMVQAVPGRAFCAGGDVRAIYHKKLQHDENLMQFFIDEYRLNQRIFHFTKPYISFLNGITMGGGAGISIHGSHRVGTENLVFAMPETAIGFFPDVGSSYFLSRMPYHCGLYLGLTGERIDLADCAALGLITQIIAPEQWDDVKKALIEHDLPDKSAVTEILNQFNHAAQPSELLTHHKVIDQCFAKNSVAEIITALLTENSAWAQKIAEVLATKSPTSLKVTFMEITNAEKMDFNECMRQEFSIMRQFLFSHDFFEGVRAMLVDKDRKPEWRPSTLDAVKNEEHFYRKFNKIK